MPTLNWIGKEAVINHHNDVPFKTLDLQYTTDASNVSENKIIHGDNLEALKALLPEYEGRIKCIYIDPPYNTGNENWVYNDNVNSPRIRKWLGQVVGKEAEDLTRHDKWLCMMYPRLKLLQKLLSDDGAIFISIDDNEQANLKLICDEIFGSGNFVGNIMWRRRMSQANLSKNIAPIHDFIVCYSKSNSTILNKIIPNINLNDYKNPDNDPRGPYVTMPSTNKGGAVYSITTPTGKTIIDEWRFKEDTYIKLKEDNRLVFPKGGDGKPRYKLFLNEKLKEGVITNTWWDNESSNQEATLDLKSIFSEKVFDTPKPVKLIQKIISLISDKTSIILDSFAGSGTTAHAVLNLNKQDGGNRKFILVEMEDYAESITAERVRRVINGYGEGKNAVAGTGGSFSYYELGEPIMNDGYLNENQPIEKIRAYIWYTETHTPLCTDTSNVSANSPFLQAQGAKCKYYLGKHNNVGYYCYYEKTANTSLDKAFLNTITEAADQYIIYADNCLLSEEFMRLNHIIFKKIPRDIRKF